MIYPHAQESLDSYWENTEFVFDESTMRWWLKQLAGLVDVIFKIHGGNTTDQEGTRSTTDLERREGTHCQHGAIMPRKILWFPPTSAYDDPRGLLKMAGSTLGGIPGSTRYGSPETRLRKPVWDASDIWGFGCILLELATWMLKGPKGKKQFSREQLRRDSQSGKPYNFKFYDIVGDRSDVIVRHGVVEWVRKLHQEGRCSAFIHDLLGMTMTFLLVIEPADRYSAFDLTQEFDRFEAKAKDPEYLVRPVPHLQLNSAKEGSAPSNQQVTQDEIGL
jgi:serine/threonine protein kinase